MDDSTFYFVIYTNNRQNVTVIDLSYSASYERDDWDCYDENIYELDEAIGYARSIAKRLSLKYDVFESRYDSTLDEKEDEPEYDYINGN